MDEKIVRVGFQVFGNIKNVTKANPILSVSTIYLNGSMDGWAVIRFGN